MDICVMEPMLGAQLIGHAAYAKDFSSRLTRHWGDTVSICAKSNISESVVKFLTPSGSIYRLYKRDPYDRWSGETLNADYIKNRKSFVSHAANVVDGIGQSDAHIYPTAFPALVAGALSATRPRPSAFIFHNSLREFSDSYLMQQHSVIKALQNPQRSGVFIFANSLGLTAEMQELGVPCSTLPYLHYVDSPPKATPNSGTASTPVVGFFGHQRNAKDGGILVEVVKHLLAANIKVLFHSSTGDILGYSHPLLDKLNGFIPPDEFSKKLSSVDLCVITNKPHLFDKKISGVTIESLANGVPVVVPANTHMDRIATRFLAGVRYHSRDGEGIYKAVTVALRHLHSLNEGAQKASKNLLALGGIHAYIDTLRQQLTSHHGGL